VTVKRHRLLAAVLLTWTAGAAAPQPAAPEPTSHERMVALLRDIAARTAEDHPLLSETQLDEVKKKLEALPPNAPAGKRLPLQLQRAELELRQNHVLEAIHTFQIVAHDTAAEIAKGRPDDGKLAMVNYRLGVAYIRLGETQNCCLRNTPDSCIAPIKGRGVHTVREGSERAIEQFEKVLELTEPDSDLHLKARWLLNIAHMTLGSYPDGVPKSALIPPSAFTSPEPFPKFPNRAQDLGVAGFNLAGGVILDDFDRDGYLDIFHSTYEPSEPLRYFRNERDGTFRLRTDEANLSGILGGFNLIQADYDNDGDVDALVLRGAWLGRTGKIPKSLVRNNGDGTFTDVTFDAGLVEPATPTQTAAWADFDNDGDLDLFVGAEAVMGYEPPCQLWRNKGDGTFEEIAEKAGVQNFRFAKGVSWGDYDEDGDPDIYVSNLGQENRLYRNNGDATFTDVARELGVALPVWSFVPWFWDFDNDGKLDLFVGNYNWNLGGLAAVVRSTLGRPDPVDRPALYKGDRTGRFEDVATARGLTETILPMGANYGDLDGDGWLDFYLGTGFPDYEGLQPNRMFRNDRGARFVDVTYAGGFGNLQKGHGIAFGDLDNDGDQDVFEQVGGFILGDKYANSLYENPGFSHRWIAVEVEGRKSNRSGFGARIRVDFVDGGRERTVWRWVGSGASFGANPLRQNIGLNNATKIKRLEIFWPTSGTTQVFEDVPRDRIVHIVEGMQELKVVKVERLRLGGKAKAK
jgi:FG-GAP-like repeat/ASPIC and UnbV